MSEYQPALTCSLYYFNLAVTSAYFTGQMLDVLSSSSVNVWHRPMHAIDTETLYLWHTHKSDIPTRTHNNLKITSTSL